MIIPSHIWKFVLLSNYTICRPRKACKKGKPFISDQTGKRCLSETREVYVSAWWQYQYDNDLLRWWKVIEALGSMKCYLDKGVVQSRYASTPNTYIELNVSWKTKETQKKIGMSSEDDCRWLRSIVLLPQLVYYNYFLRRICSVVLKAMTY